MVRARRIARSFALALSLGLAGACDAQGGADVAIVKDLGARAAEAGEADVPLGEITSFEWDRLRAIGGGVPKLAIETAFGAPLELPKELEAAFQPASTLLMFYQEDTLVAQAVVAAPAFVSVVETLTEIPRGAAFLKAPAGGGPGHLVEAR